ncbi:hypothetical protein SLOPH_1061 [Spraguea lophii 42_110]|uniref:Uncharacterized protein n=1 Tax=Spraguea lophii (strain 42_110) TaxID=1358809 RepID=S7WA60_SPRLO|nr:hypothetical protein SLOPH_1061 [Spraguea lophii 42_110]
MYFYLIFNLGYIYSSRENDNMDGKEKVNLSSEQSSSNIVTSSNDMSEHPILREPVSNYFIENNNSNSTSTIAQKSSLVMRNSQSHIRQFPYNPKLHSQLTLTQRHTGNYMTENNIDQQQEISKKQFNNINGNKPTFFCIPGIGNGIGTKNMSNIINRDKKINESDNANDIENNDTTSSECSEFDYDVSADVKVTEKVLERPGIMLQPGTTLHKYKTQDRGTFEDFYKSNDCIFDYTYNESSILINLRGYLKEDIPVIFQHNSRLEVSDLKIKKYFLKRKRNLVNMESDNLEINEPITDGTTTIDKHKFIKIVIETAENNFCIYKDISEIILIALADKLDADGEDFEDINKAYDEQSETWSTYSKKIIDELIYDSFIFVGMGDHAYMVENVISTIQNEILEAKNDIEKQELRAIIKEEVKNAYSKRLQLYLDYSELVGKIDRLEDEKYRLESILNAMSKE